MRDERRPGPSTLRPADDHELITADEPEPTEDEVIAKTQALIADLIQLQADYDQLDHEAKA
jgi:hypothetical protein